MNVESVNTTIVRLIMRGEILAYINTVFDNTFRADSLHQSV